MPTLRPLPVLVPERLRQVPRSFAWIDHRLRSARWLERLTPAEIALYLFLVLAADRQGLSCWRLDRIEREMPAFDRTALRRARDGLVETDLIAFRPWGPTQIDGPYQVLSLPPTAARARPRGGVASIGETLGEVLKGKG
jgi:hypothetical protein